MNSSLVYFMSRTTKVYAYTVRLGVFSKYMNRYKHYRQKMAPIKQWGTTIFGPLSNLLEVCLFRLSLFSDFPSLPPPPGGLPTGIFQCQIS